MAYPGALLGYEYIHEIAHDELFRRFLRRLWDREVIPTLAPVPDVDPAAYTTTLIGRFSNPATRDRTSRVCMDGSSKLPAFILPSVRDQLIRGGSIRLLSFAIASWCRYLTGRDEKGRTIEIVDPLANALQAAAKRGPAALLTMDDVFGDDLRGAGAFIGDVEAAFNVLAAQGTRAALAGYLREAESDNPS
jgi:mannitol 2-dehydrogenase